MKRTVDALVDEVTATAAALEADEARLGLTARKQELERLRQELRDAMRAARAEAEARRPRVWLIFSTHDGVHTKRYEAIYSTRALAEANLPKLAWKRKDYHIEEYILDSATEKDYVPPPSP